jgi:hypothetical protein
VVHAQKAITELPRRKERVLQPTTTPTTPATQNDAQRAYEYLLELQLRSTSPNTHKHPSPSCLVRMKPALKLALASTYANSTFVIQEAQATTDTSPSSPTKVAYTKSVRSNISASCLTQRRCRSSAAGRAPWLTIRPRRICIQGNHGSEHHITGRAGQGLCSSHLAEEGACTCYRLSMLDRC